MENKSTQNIQNITPERQKNSLPIYKKEKINKIKIIMNEETPLYKSYLTSVEASVTDIKFILDSEDSLELKQEKLEALNISFQANINSSRFQVPPESSKYVSDINKLLINVLNPKDLYKIVNEKGNYNGLGKDKQIAYEYLFNLIDMAKNQNKDFGLALLYYFSKSVRTFTAKKEFHSVGNFAQKLGTYSSELNVMFDDFSIKKTTLILKLAKELHMYCKLLAQLALSRPNYKVPSLSEDQSVELGILLGVILEKSNLVVEESCLINSDDMKNKKEKNTQLFYKLDKKAIALFIHLSPFESINPSIMPPCDWTIDENKEMKGGGFQINKKVDLFSGVHLKSNKSFTEVDSNSVEAINYLQSQKFSVNSTELDIINKNFDFYLSNYLSMSIPDWKNLFFFDKKTETYNMFSLLKYIEAQIEVMSGSNQSKSAITKKAQNKYASVINCYIKFKHMVCIANLFKNRNIYFTCYMDSRGRIYYMGFGVFPHGDAFGKLLLNLGSPVVQKAPKETPYSSSQVGKKFFERRKELYDSLVSLDVSCSGVQIVGGLTGCIDALISTNFVSKKNEPIEKKDLYTAVLNEMFLKFERGELIKKIEKKNSFNLEDPKNKNIILSEIPFFIERLDRSFLKGWVMRYVYSEGHNTRVRYLFDDYFNDKKNWNKLKNIPDDLLLVIPESISECFSEAFESLYPQLVGFANLLQETTKLIAGPSIWIRSQEKGIITCLNYCKQTQVKKYYYHWKRGTRSSIIVYTDSMEKDLGKMRSSFVANFIHNLDSEILKEVVVEFKKRNEPIWVIHDCFLVSKKESTFVKEVYFNAFKKCIFTNNSIYMLLKENFILCGGLNKSNTDVKSIFAYYDLCLSNKKCETYSQIDKNRLQCKELLEIEYERSLNILS